MTTSHRRLLVVPALALIAAACEHSPYDATGGEAGLELAVRFSENAMAGGAQAAFDKGDRLWLHLADGTTTRAQTDVPASHDAGTVQAPIRVRLHGIRETLDLQLELRIGGAALFRGETPVTLRVGRTTRAEVTIEPVVAGVRAPGDVPVLESYGDTLELGGAAVFATGDTLFGRTVQWSLLDEGAVSLEDDGTVVALRDGEARVVANVGSFADTAAVRVFARVRSIAISPPVASIPIGATRPFTATLFDARHNAIPGRAVTWSSSDPGIVTIDASGLATGLAEGAVTIHATAGNVLATLDVAAVPSAPLVDTTYAAVDAAAAQLTARIDPNGGDTRAYFEWGTDSTFTRFSTTAVQSITAGQAVVLTDTVRGLTANTVYYARAVASNNQGTSRGVRAIFVFTTPPAGNGLPIVVTAGASGVSGAQATIIGTVDPNAPAADAWFEWSTSPTFSTYATTPLQTVHAGGPITVLAVLTGLSPSTTYYYRTVGRNVNGTARGAALAFTTSGTPNVVLAPTVTTTAATGINDARARLNAVVNPNANATDAWFEWGTDPGLVGASSSPLQAIGAGTTDVNVNAVIKPLVGGVVYYFRVVARNAGGTVQGAILSFTAVK